jgi:small-conductance mechanosensitive channel
MNKETIEHIIFVVITLAVITILSIVIRKILSKIIHRNSVVLGVDATTYVFLKNSITFILYTIGIFWIFYKIPYFKSLGGALFAGAGVLAAVIGFASQKAFSNIISGLFILMFKPFKVGDVIEISGGKKGMVESITLRHTVIKDFEFRRVIVPNSIISDETITNSNITDTKIRKHITFSISYDSNIELAKKIITQKIDEHPFHIDNRTPEEITNNDPVVLVRVVNLGEYSVDLKAYVWTKDNENSFQLQCDVLHTIKNEFDKQGIEIPFPYRTIVYKNDQKK